MPLYWEFTVNWKGIKFSPSVIQEIKVKHCFPGSFTGKNERFAIFISQYPTVGCTLYVGIMNPWIFNSNPAYFNNTTTPLSEHPSPRPAHFAHQGLLIHPAYIQWRRYVVSYWLCCVINVKDVNADYTASWILYQRNQVTPSTVQPPQSVLHLSAPK